MMSMTKTSAVIVCCVMKIRRKTKQRNSVTFFLFACQQNINIIWVERLSEENYLLFLHVFESVELLSVFERQWERKKSTNHYIYDVMGIPGEIYSINEDHIHVYVHSSTPKAPQSTCKTIQSNHLLWCYCISLHLHFRFLFFFFLLQFDFIHWLCTYELYGCSLLYKVDWFEWWILHIFTPCNEFLLLDYYLFPFIYDMYW